MSKNANLSNAKKEKNDEFYTQYKDIENEIFQYEKEKFQDKIIFCNCNDSEKSNFWRFFKNNFIVLGLKKLIATYSEDGQGYKIEYDGKEVRKEKIEGGGDFSSDECIELLKQSDIVVTNPPFSLFREYVSFLIQHKKLFLILGNPNAITYKEFFPLLKENKVWIGNKSMGTDMLFFVPKDYEKWLIENKKEGSGYRIVKGRIMGRAMAIWYTNIDHPKRHQKLPLDLGFTYKGHENMYPKYDNYDAINVDKVNQIPYDYEPCWYKCPHKNNCVYAQTEGKEDDALCETQCNGEMGVPITFLDKHCPEQFEIIANGGSYNGADSIASELYINCSQFVNVERDEKKKRKNERRKVYCRIVIRKLQ